MIEATAPPTTDRRSTADRAGGIGGLVFVAAVIVQNLLKVGLPKADAGARTVTEFYADHHGASVTLAILYACSAIGLALFAGGLLTRLFRSAPSRASAVAGAMGVVGIYALFSTMLALDLALAAYVHRGATDPSTVIALWTTHNAVFGVLAISIGIALGMLARSAVAAGLLPKVWQTIGLVGGLLLVIDGAATPSVIEGGPLMMVGLVGFLGWLGFVAVSARAMLRTGSAQTATTAVAVTA